MGTNGFRSLRSNALTAEPTLGFGYITTFKINTNVFLKLELNNFLSIGGRIRERRCIDDFLREYHCGTVIPWTDYEPQKKQKTSLIR